MKFYIKVFFVLYSISCKKSNLYYQEVRTGRLDRSFRTNGATKANSGYH